MHSRYDDDEFERLKKINDANTLLKTDSIGNVTQEQWNEAAYVEVGVRPIDTDKAPDYAFGHIEFKGHKPKSATYYIQGGEETSKTKDAILSAHKAMVSGDGFDSHGSQSGRAFMNISAKMGTPPKLVSAILAKGRFNLKL